VSTYGSLAYSQFSSTYLIQIASVTGLWGVAFLMCWLASTLNWAWEEGMDWARIRRGVAIFSAVMLVVLLYGMVRLEFAQPQTGSARIHGVIETDYTAEQWSREVGPLIGTNPAAVKAKAAPIYDRYVNATIREARAGAQMVVWPELAAYGYKEDLDALLARVKDVARQEGIYVALGTGLLTPNPASTTVDENRLLIVDPKGSLVVNQLKYGCMPAPGMYGAQIQTVDTPFGRVGGVICCDADFPYVLSQASQKGIDILLVPAFEPTPENLTAHSQMVQFRAIENGVSIFRPTVQGVSLAIDPVGRALVSMTDTRVDKRVFVAQLPNHRVFTVYSVIGDAVGWLAVAGFVALAVVALRRPRTAPSPSRRPA
jgi:apolipoprotein N-acyltransferase